MDISYPSRLEHGRKQSEAFATGGKFGQEDGGLLCRYFNWRTMIAITVNGHQVSEVTVEQSSGVKNVNISSVFTLSTNTRRKGEGLWWRPSQLFTVSHQKWASRGRL